ncbi:myb/SANT-like DNA-binding domain-containing protein 4 isoform X1 [Halyomorpha halys]|uniref:myb/SANT-like DNA-binding domain-containing protein 4 isoform X1 n=1 Tax=Halyomorpha halys TaxID=286706 RepID=UPI0006D4DFED|nr:myb/SANT-like DNA-binding domain-containing protein 4 [Halyomorpha halys]
MEHRNPRAANFTKEEESLLLKLVSSHSDVIENKKIDAVSNSLKVQEWEQIEKEFNSQNCGIKGQESRDALSLKRKYENIKKSVKKKLSGLKINLTKNGPEESVVLSDEQTQLLQVIVPQVTGFQNTYGDDESAHDNQIDQNKDNEIGTDSYAVVDGVKVESIEATESFETPTSTSSPQLLVSSSDTVQPSVGPASKLPKATSSNFQYFDPMQLSSLDRSSHPELRTRKRNRPLDKMAAWVASKADIAQQEQIFKKELHEQKKRHLEEEHNLRKQMLEQQLRHAEEQHSWLREEHLEKMKQIKLSR